LEASCGKVLMIEVIREVIRDLEIKILAIPTDTVKYANIVI